MGSTWRVLVGDVRDRLAELPDASVQCCVTSPPCFGLRDYGVDGQIGLETTPDAFVAALVGVFREVRRVLRDDGTVWLNLGDSYVAAGGGGESRMLELHGRESGRCVGVHAAAGKGQTSGGRGAVDGLKPKQLLGIPWRVAFALQADGWYLRQDIIWHKPNPMPESVRDRCTKAHEYLFLLTKRERYYFDAAAIAEEATGRAPGNTRPTKAALTHGDHHRTAASLHEIGARQARADCPAVAVRARRDKSDVPVAQGAAGRWCRRTS